jgi:hypothetical protein
MKFSVTLLGVALYLFSSAEAGITTNTPFNTVTWNGGETETVVWDDDGKAPKLAEIGITTIDLFFGNETSQTLVANIGKAPATAKTIDYKVPKDVGPPGNSYFIKYTAGTYTSFSGSFSIAKVNGKLVNTDPTAGPPKDPNTPVAADPNAPKVTDPNTAKAAVPAPYGGSTPKSISSSAAASPTASTTAQSSLPEPISNNASNLFPSFSGVATAAIAFAFTYLY